MALQVVSIPAMRTSAAVPRTMLSSTRAPSISVWRRSLKRSSPGLLRRCSRPSRKYPMSPLAPRILRSGSSANSRMSRTQPVKVSDRSSGDAEDLRDDPDGDLLCVLLGGVGVTGLLRTDRSAICRGRG